MSLVYHEVSPGIRIGLPKNLGKKAVAQRIEKYKNNLERSKEQIYNPKIKSFNPCKF